MENIISSALRPMLTRNSRPGLTLLELLIVVAILAVLATVVVRSLTPLADQARYETTKRTMENVRDAVVGDSSARQLDGTPLVTGFVADMGRLPISRNTNPATLLSELWESPTFAGDVHYPYALRPGTIVDIPENDDLGLAESQLNCSDVSLACGWRGPYLQGGRGQGEIRDGWGIEFLHFAPGPLSEQINIPNVSIERLEWIAKKPFDQSPLLPVVLSERAFNQFVIRVVVKSGSDIERIRRLSAVLLEPNAPTSSEDAVLPHLTHTLLHVSYLDTDPAVLSSQLLFDNVSIGQRAIKIQVDVQRAGTPETINDLPPKYFIVPHAGTTEVYMEIE